MKIKRIKITNYRGKNFDFTPAAINILLGPNGYGKTSLCDAIRYGLTGLTPHDDIREATVSLTLEDGKNGLFIERSRGDSTICKVNGEKISEKAMNGAISKMIGTSIEDVKIISSSDVFLSKRPDEFLQLLIQYIPEELNLKTILQYMQDPTDEAVRAVKDYFEKKSEKFGITEIDSACKYFLEQRKRSKQEKKNCEVVISGSNPDIPKRSIQEVEDALTEAAIQEKSWTVMLQQKAKYDDAVKRRQEQLQKVNDLNSRVNNITVVEPSEEALKTFKSQKEAAEKELLAKNCELTTVKNNLVLFKQTLENLEKPVCPISSKLICTTDKMQIRNDMETALADNQRLYQSIQKTISEQNRIVQESITKIRDYESNRSAYERRLRWSGELLAYLDNLVVVPEKPGDMPNKDQVPIIKQQLLNERRNIEQYVLRKKAESELIDINKKIATYDYLVNSLDDKGDVKKSIMKYYLSTFEDICNTRAATFAPEYKIKFETDNGVKIYAKTPSNDNFYHIGALSDGEAAITIFLILDMLNQLTKVGIIFFDNLEALDDQNINCLAELIKKTEFQVHYDHIFICGVDHSNIVDALEEIEARRL